MVANESWLEGRSRLASDSVRAAVDYGEPVWLKFIVIQVIGVGDLSWLSV